MLKSREGHKGRRCFSDCDACRRPHRCPFRQAATSARPVSEGSSLQTTPCRVPEKEGSPHCDRKHSTGSALLVPDEEGPAFWAGLVQKLARYSGSRED